MVVAGMVAAVAGMALTAARVVIAVAGMAEVMMTGQTVVK
jgi:hypothetical protein